MPPSRTAKRIEAAEPVLPLSPTFNEDVYAVVRRIPEGQASVASYGDIAKLLGRPKNSRLVGAALKHLPRALASPYLPTPPPATEYDIIPAPLVNPDFVPWHRVLNSSGVISPRAGGLRPLMRQAEFLQAEGVEVKDGPRAGGANAGPPGGVDAFGLGGLHGGRVSMALYRWDGRDRA